MVQNRHIYVNGAGFEGGPPLFFVALKITLHTRHTCSARPDVQTQTKILQTVRKTMYDADPSPDALNRRWPSLAEPVLIVEAKAAALSFPSTTARRLRKGRAPIW